MSDQRQEDWVCIWYPPGPMQVSLVHAALSGTDIRYIIENENYSTWTDGLVGVADSRMRVLVDPARADEARELLESLVPPQEDGEEEGDPS